MVKGAFQGALDLASYDDADEIGVAVDAVDRGVGIEIDDRNIQNDHLPGLGVIASMDEKALVFVPEVIAKDAVYTVAFLFDDQFGQVVVMHAGHFHVGTSEPRSGGGLCAQTLCGHQAEYN